MIDFKTFIEESEMELLDEASTISSRLAIREHNQILKPLISIAVSGDNSFISTLAKGASLRGI